MKLRTSVQHLADAVAHTAKALAARTPVPVLLGILLTADEDGLHLAASDTEVYATDRISAEIADGGRILVPGRLLADITAKLPKGAEADLEADDTRLTLVCGSARFSLPLLPVEEYPALPALPAAVATVDADTWADAVAQVAVAASTDAAIPALTGVHFTLDGATATLVATDRYRIGLKQLTVQPTGTLPAAPAKKRGKKNDSADTGLPQALIPAKTLADAARALAGEHTLTLHWDQGLVGWSIPGGKTLSTRILDGYEFPDMTRMIPDGPLTLTVATEETIAAVQRVALVAARNTPVRLTLLDGELTIEAGSGDDAHAADTVPANIDGDTTEHAGPDGRYTVAFNPGYLADALKAIATPEAAIILGHPHKPARIVGRTGDLDESYRHVLMPIRLSS